MKSLLLSASVAALSLAASGCSEREDSTDSDGGFTLRDASTCAPQ